MTEFNLERTLGEGAFGKVYLVTNCENDKQFAMKVIDLRTSPQEEKELAVRESQLLKKLCHDHVLAYTDSFEKDGALCIVTEFCANGDLSEFLEKRNGRKLEEDQLIEWFRQITSALQYLHGKTIIHRDVKTPNIFLTDSWDTKLGDLGLAKVLERPSAKAVTFCGSPYYMSPEIFSCKPYDSKSDIWALGVIVYEMSTLERPFDAQLMHQLVFKIVHDGLPPMPTGYKPELSDLLSKIMQKDPLKRPTADEILEHDLFKGSKKPEVPPKPKQDGGGAASSRWGDIIKRKPNKGGEAAGGGPFDMKELIGTLTALKLKEKEDKKQANPDGPTGSDADTGINTIIAKNVDTDTKFNKTVKNMKSTLKPKGDVSISDVSLDFEQTLKSIQSKTAGEAFNTMQLIVRTMTGVFPDKDETEKEEAFKRSKDPMGMMLRQIEHLQYYCTKVLNNDVSLFQRAYDMLAKEKDEHKLEGQLIRILGPEKFGLCGVQLMFLKNFEYNLHKLQDAGLYLSRSLCRILFDETEGQVKWYSTQAMRQDTACMNEIIPQQLGHLTMDSSYFSQQYYHNILSKPSAAHPTQV